VKVAFALLPCWSTALIMYAPGAVWFSAEAIATKEPDTLADTVCGTVTIVMVPHVTVIVSTGLKPAPVIVVDTPVFGDSVIVGTTVTAGVTVYVLVTDAIWLPSASLAVAWIVYVPVGCEVPSMLLKLAEYLPVAFVVAIVVYALLPCGSVTLRPTSRPVAGFPSALSVPVIVTVAPCL